MAGVWRLAGGVTDGHRFWTWLWGPVGLLLATPPHRVPGRARQIAPVVFLDVLLSDEPVVELNRYYQRLVARDHDGAVEVVEDLLKTQTLGDVCDAVLLPALYYAEQDQRRNTLTDEETRFIYQATRELVDNLGASQAVTSAAEVPVAPVEDTATTFPPPSASWPVRRMTRPTRWRSRCSSTCLIPGGLRSRSAPRRCSRPQWSPW